MSIVGTNTIVNISKKYFRVIWQWLNLRYLYHLLYPYMAQDFRHQGDCSLCVSFVQLHATKHIHPAPGGVTGTPIPGVPPLVPIPPMPWVTPAIGVGLIAPVLDPISSCPARLGFVPTIQAFDPTNIVNIGKSNIAPELDPASAFAEDARDITEQTLDTAKLSKFFTT